MQAINVFHLISSSELPHTKVAVCLKCLRMTIWPPIAHHAGQTQRAKDIETPSLPLHGTRSRIVNNQEGESLLNRT